MVDMSPRVAKLGYMWRIQEMFLMFHRNIFCVSATNFVTRYNVSEVAKLRNIQDTYNTRQRSTCMSLFESELEGSLTWNYTGRVVLKIPFFCVGEYTLNMGLINKG